MTCLCRLLLFVLSIASLVQLAGCTTTSHHNHQHHYFSNDGPPPGAYTIDVSKIPDAVPKLEPLSRYGNPSSYSANGRRYYVMHSSAGYNQRGIASWYGMKFHSKRTSSGEPYDLMAMTAAHPTLPLPTYVQVINLENHRQVVVKVNDRGPFEENRLIDLSFAAAKKLGLFPKGTGLVEVKAIDPRHYSAKSWSETKPIIRTGMAINCVQLYLQIGAFSSSAHAENLAKRIKYLTSHTVRIKAVYGQLHTLYKVQIGPLDNIETSDQVHHRLQSAGIGDAMTVIQ